MQENINRAENFRRYVRSSGLSRKAFCESRELNYQSITNTLTYPEHKFTATVARNLEGKLGLVEGYFDKAIDVSDTEGNATDTQM